MIEAELKARVHAPETVLRLVDERATGRAEVYQDTYYDMVAGTLDAEVRELRVRTVHGPDGTRSILTYKEPRIDEASGSKPEYETRVTDPDAVHAMLRGLGYVPAHAFEKRCRNYEFEAHGPAMLATLLRVPELDGTFLEIETQVKEQDDLQDALDAVRAVLAELGIAEDDLTTDTYTGAVRAQRSA